MRILIVEDERNVTSYLQTSLEAEGFAVDIAEDGEAGLGLALTNAYDAITLDIMLPGMNGYRVCEEIRKAGVETPILMLTAKDGEYDEADALDIGADDFLRKPFSLVVLIARLRALLRRGAGRAKASLRVGDLELDLSTKCAVRSGRRIELTPREFALLEYLMYNAGTVLTKAQILDHGFDGEVGGIVVNRTFARDQRRNRIRTQFDEGRQKGMAGQNRVPDRRSQKIGGITHVFSPLLVHCVRSG